MAADWSSLFILAFVVMVIASVWGAVALSVKWVKNPWKRVFLGLVLCAVFLIAGTTAIVSGCVAVMGTPNLH